MKKLIAISTLLFGVYQLSAYQNEKAGFTITINGEMNPYRIYSTFVLPDELVKISSDSIISISPKEFISSEAMGVIELKAPSQPGIYSVEISSKGNQKMSINLMVLTPMDQKKAEYLNGYRIGNYPKIPLRGDPIYNRPKGLFEVTEDNIDQLLTPHFNIRQFVCKQAGGYPKYILVRERLLLKLEYLLEKVNDRGFEIETFGFISGYRTPYYNASIKNVQYSRHVFGGAADIFIDQDNNGSMDDLNADGRVDEKDVRIFYDLVEVEYNKESYRLFRGGLGFYRKNSRHNGFIHVDVRGSKARW